MDYFTIATAAAALVAAALFRQWRRNRGVPRLPPGPIGLPLLGNLLSLSPQLHVHFAELAETHGPIYRLHLGSLLTIVVSSPTLVREVLRDNDAVLANHSAPATSRVAAYDDMASSPLGPTWRMLRRVCVHEVLGPASLDAAYGHRRREVRATVARVRASGGDKVEVGTEMFVTLVNAVTSMLWGGAADEVGVIRDATESREFLAEMTSLLAVPNISDFFPILERFDLQGLQGRMGMLTGRLYRMFDSIIERRKAAKEGAGNDFLGYMLKLKEEGDDKTAPFTMSNLKGLLMNMFVGSVDTTSATMEWAMAEMLRKPEVMRRVQEELDRVIGENNIVEESHLPKLRYLGAVIKEVLRLHPALPLMIPHTPSAPCTVGGYLVPKGSNVFVNVWAIHRDPSIWKDPLKFDPERFLGTNIDMDFKGSDFSYFPFGSGRRICPGISMAERMMTYLLASLLYSFDWKLPEGEELDFSERFGIVLKKEKALAAVPTPRLPNPEQYA